MSQMLFEAKGTSKVVTGNMKVLGFVIMVLGIFLCLASQMSHKSFSNATITEGVLGPGTVMYTTGKVYEFSEDVRAMMLILGALAIILGMYIVIKSSQNMAGSKNFIRVFDDHVEGKFNEGTVSMNLKYGQMRECSVVKMGKVRHLLINSHAQTYDIIIEDKNLLKSIYEYINSKL